MKHLSLKLCLLITLFLGNVTASYALSNCPSDQTKRYHNCFGTETYASGNTYVGEYKECGY